MHSLTNYFLIFHYYMLYCYTSLNSSIICCIFSGDMYLPFDVSDSSFASLFCGCVEDFFETLVILLAILLQIKSPDASVVFWIALVETVFIASVIDFLHHQEVFDHIYCLSVYPHLFFFFFFKRQKYLYF